MSNFVAECAECAGPLSPEDAFCGQCGHIASASGIADSAPILHTNLIRTAAKSRPRRILPRQTIVLLSVFLVSATVLVGGTAWVTQQPKLPSQSVAPPTITSVMTLPGFSTTPDWSIPIPSETTTVSADGLLTGCIHEGNQIRIIDSGTGEVLSDSTLDAQILAIKPVTVAGKFGLVAQTSISVTVWVPGIRTPHQVPLPTDAQVAIRGSGNLLVLTGADHRQVSVMTETVGSVMTLVPYVSPQAGASPFTDTSSGTMLWAAWPGNVLEGTAAGTIVRSITLAPPATAATIVKWVSVVSGHVYIVWSIPGTGTALVSHNLTDGSVVGIASVDDSLSGNRFLLSQDGTAAMFGPIFARLQTGLLTIPDPKFLPTTVLGSGFYGAAGTKPALLTLFPGGPPRVIEVPPPEVIPVGATASGNLLTLANGELESWSTTTLSTPSQLPEKETK